MSGVRTRLPGIQGGCLIISRAQALAFWRLSTNLFADTVIDVVSQNPADNTLQVVARHPDGIAGEYRLPTGGGYETVAEPPRQDLLGDDGA
jgi:hypothetical protein